MSGRPLLLVDGYNVIAQDRRYSRLLAQDADTARARLVGDVADYAAGLYDATIVFDAAGNPEADGAPHRLAGATVIFAGEGTDADSVIESLVHQAATGREVVVATSDADTQWTTMREGVRRMSAPELVREMGSEAAERRTHETDEGGRAPLETRVDEETRARLFRWARGE